MFQLSAADKLLFSGSGTNPAVQQGGTSIRAQGHGPDPDPDPTRDLQEFGI